MSKRKNPAIGGPLLALALIGGSIAVAAVVVGSRTQKKAKTKKKAALAPPKEVFIFDVEQPPETWPEAPEELLFNNGFVVNEECTALISVASIEALKKQMGRYVAKLIPAMAAELGVTETRIRDEFRELSLDSVVFATILYLEQGRGTAGCLPLDPQAPNVQFIAGLLIYAAITMNRVVADAGLITEKQYWESVSFLAGEAKQAELTDEVMQAFGFPTLTLPSWTR